MLVKVTMSVGTTKRDARPLGGVLRQDRKTGSEEDPGKKGSAHTGV